MDTNTCPNEWISLFNLFFLFYLFCFFFFFNSLSIWSFRAILTCTGVCLLYSYYSLVRGDSFAAVVSQQSRGEPSSVWMSRCVSPHLLGVCTLFVTKLMYVNYIIYLTFITWGILLHYDCNPKFQYNQAVLVPKPNQIQPSDTVNSS